MDNKKTVMLTIEHIEREFVPKIFLAYKLALKGFRVYIGTFSAMRTVARRLKPSIFFHKSTYVKRSEYYKSLGHKFVFMDEEAGPSIPRSILESFCNHRYLTVNEKRNDIIFVASKYFMKYLSNMANIKGVSIIETGWPRVDLWRQKYQYIYEDEANKIKLKHGSFYLLISGFGITSKNAYENKIHYNNGLSKSFSDLNKKRITHKYYSFLNYMELVKDITKILKSDEKLIIRPHPSENINDWEKITKGIENAFVIRDGDISPWIIAADSILQYGSTTAIQASLNGKTCIQYRIEKQEGITDTPSFELCNDANTPEEVYCMLLANKGKFDNAVYERAVTYLTEWMAFDKNELAVDKIVEVLDRIEREKVSKAKFTFFDKQITPILLFLKSILNKYYLKIQYPKFERQTELDKLAGGIRADEVNKIITKLQKNKKTKENVIAEQVFSNLVCIENKDIQ
jgi:surface carbohydrate biosynthesis protein